MERIFTQDERIRRAEEIYARRQSLREKTRRATVNVSNTEPKNFKLFKKLVLQIIICVLIYFIFYLVNTTNYTFSKGALEKTEELITEDVDFVGIYNNFTNWLNSVMPTIIDDENKEENKIEENTVMENTVDENAIGEQGEAENVVGGESENLAVVGDNQETTGQMEITDVELSETDRIKQKYSFVLPLKRKNILRVWRKRGNLEHNVYIS